MKLKKLFSAIGLGLFAVASVSAGVLAFAKGPRMEMAKADGEPWMITISFDNSGPETSEDWGYIDGQEIHYWGTGFDPQTLALHQTGRDHLYTTNIVFKADETLSGLTINFYETKNEVRLKKESKDITLSLDKDANGNCYCYYFNANWDAGGKYEAGAYAAPTTNFGFFGGVQKDFVPEPSKSRYALTDVAMVEDQYIELRVLTNNWTGNLTGSVARDNDPYIKDNGTAWLQIKYTGTYDFFLTNDYDDGGIFVIKMHSDSREYIYLVGGDITEDTCIYTFGESGVEEFGAFPGKPLKEVVDAEEIHGDLKFQGEENNIWRVELNMNYPAADHIVLVQLNEFGVVGTQTADMLLMRKSAYWFSDVPDYHNTDAGYALDFLFLAEAYRKAATDGSVCDISLIGAQDIVSEYNSKGAYMQTTYIDNTLVNTWTDNTRTVKAYVSYKSVVQELAKKVEAAGTNQTISFGYQTNGNMIVIIISVITTISIAGVVALVIIRKRKHQ